MIAAGCRSHRKQAHKQATSLEAEKQVAEGSRSKATGGCAYAASLVTTRELPRDECGGVLREGRVFYDTQRHPFPVQFAEGLRAMVIGQGGVVAAEWRSPIRPGKF